MHALSPDVSVQVAIAPPSPAVLSGIRALVAWQPRIEVVDAPREADHAAARVLLVDAGAPRADLSEQMADASADGWRLLGWAWPGEARRRVRRPDAREVDAWVGKDADGRQLASTILGLAAPGRHVSGPAAPGQRRTDVLSEREEQMIALIAAGLSNAEIASRCFLSINSVKTFIRSAYRKIEVSRRVDAVVWAHENGVEISCPQNPPAA